MAEERRGLACALRAEEKCEMGTSTPPSQCVGDRQANSAVCAKSHHGGVRGMVGGGCLAHEPGQLTPGPAEKGLAPGRGIDGAAGPTWKVLPLPFLLRRKVCGGSGGPATGEQIGPTVFRPRTLVTPQPGMRYRRAIGEKGIKRWSNGTHVGARVSTWRRGLLALAPVKGSVWVSYFDQTARPPGLPGGWLGG